MFQTISSRLPERGRKRREKIEVSKNVQTTPTRTYCKRYRSLPYYHPNCRTPRHWKFSQDHRTILPPPHNPNTNMCEVKNVLISPRILYLTICYCSSLCFFVVVVLFIFRWERNCAINRHVHRIDHFVW